MIGKLVAAASILLLGVTAVAAQSCQDPITARQTIMKKSGAMAKIGSSMIKGEIPFDLEKTKEIFAAFEEDAKAMPTLFPDCSKTGDNSATAPAVWEKPDEFKAAIAQFAADIKAAQGSTKDVETLKASFQSIGKDCGGCHQTFRIKKS
jgi:cytochrome c556